MITFNKHVRWRVDKKEILVCDCKNLTDLKLPKGYKAIMKSFEKGLNKKKLNENQKILLSDLKKLKLVSRLDVRPLANRNLPEALSLLDREMGTERVRNRSFLKRKFDANRRFFLGLFLDTDLIGIICGFPRDDYLLISEIAVDSRFRKRGFGRLLVKEFENVAKRARHARIHVGAQDKVIGFYKSLGYKPFLLIQFKEKDYSLDDFKKFNILRKRHIAQGAILEVESKTSNLKKLKNLRKKFPKAYFQYIFAKKI